jgi:hypothetical protein
LELPFYRRSGSATSLFAHCSLLNLFKISHPLLPRAAPAPLLALDLRLLFDSRSTALRRAPEGAYNFILERAVGVEPTYLVWKTSASPLGQARNQQSALFERTLESPRHLSAPRSPAGTPGVSRLDAPFGAPRPTVVLESFLRPHSVCHRARGSPDEGPARRGAPSSRLFHPQRLCRMRKGASGGWPEASTTQIVKNTPLSRLPPLRQTNEFVPTGLVPVGRGALSLGTSVLLWSWLFTVPSGAA